jgi:hypothetical protein
MVGLANQSSVNQPSIIGLRYVRPLALPLLIAGRLKKLTLA